MSFLTKKEKITLFSEQQKDQFIEKLDQAHVDYDIRESTKSIFSDKAQYIVSVKASDLKKVS